MRIATILLPVLMLGAAVLPANAEEVNSVAGHYQIRLRGLGVLPDPEGSKVFISGANIGGKTSLTDSGVPEIDATYFVSEHFAVEAIAATTKHSASHSVAGPLGSVWLLPPTVTVQYHLQPTDPLFRPYVGVGLNYTFFYNAKSPLPGISYDDNAGFALQAGADIPVGKDGYFLNVDVKKLFLGTTLHAASGTVKGDVNIDPWIVGAGVGIRF
ncbi:MAG: OmpW family protein [Alphaproteobacteria bacterium]|nr:OmpW family protein [Alphaproteobacteria bacterium]